MISDFAIAAGAPASYYNADTDADVDVVIKPLEEEHFMRANDTTAACTASGLSIVNYANQFVSLDTWIDPATLDMGEIPYSSLISRDPSVIAGEVQ